MSPLGDGARVPYWWFGIAERHVALSEECPSVVSYWWFVVAVRHLTVDGKGENQGPVLVVWRCCKTDRPRRYREQKVPILVVWRC